MAIPNYFAIGVPINMTNAFNAEFECPTHCADVFKFKYLPSPLLGDFLLVLSENASIMFLHFPRVVFCTGVLCAAVNLCSANI